MENIKKLKIDNRKKNVNKNNENRNYNPTEINAHYIRII
jgi:hypothetical protein